MRCAVDVPRDEHLAGRGGQESQRAIQELGQLVTLQLHIHVDAVCGLNVDVGIVALIRPDEPREFPPLGARPAPADGAGDGRQPAVTSPGIVQLVGVAPGLEQGFLGQVLRRVDIARQPSAQAHQPGPFKRGVRLRALRSVHRHAHQSPLVLCWARPAIY
jgi:hypothetical protein